MGFSEWGKWRGILLAVFCAIVILVLVILGVSSSPEHSIANMYFIPAGIFTIGTCGSDTMPMTYSTDIEPAFATSFLQQFGEREPGPGPSLPPIMDYPVRQQAINALMDRAQIAVSEDSIIGLYELPDSRLLLIDQGTSMTEILETGEGIRIFTLVPELVGSRHIGADETGPVKSGAYNNSYEHTVTIQRIYLMLPHQGNETAPMYIVKKTRIDYDLYPDGTHFATISTTGTFYVIYGQRVERVISSSVITPDPQWTLCSEWWERSGEGGTMGELKHTIKLAWSSERIVHSLLITTGAYIQVHDANMGSTNQWMSRDSTGCSC